MQRVGLAAMNDRMGRHGQPPPLVSAPEAALDVGMLRCTQPFA